MLPSPPNCAGHPSDANQPLLSSWDQNQSAAFVDAAQMSKDLFWQLLLLLLRWEVPAALGSLNRAAAAGLSEGTSGCINAAPVRYRLVRKPVTTLFS